MTPWTAVHQASLTFTISDSLLKLMSIELMMPSSHLILCHPLLLLPSIFPSIRVCSKESAVASGGWSIGAWASASVLPMSIQSWFPLGLTGLILLSNGFPRIFSRTTFWKHQDYKSAITNIFSILKEICLKNKGMYGNFISPRREF